MNYNNSLSLWNFDEYFFKMSREDERTHAQLARAGTPSPRVIGIDEIAIRKGHTYRIVCPPSFRKHSTRNCSLCHRVRRAD